jgi:predicted SAM-dependent methyltransferase
MRGMIKSALERLVPVPLAQQLIHEAGAHVRHWPSWLKNRNRFRGQRGLKVNVGCGGNIVDGWVNLDLTTDPRVICWDCRRSLPFDDVSVSHIFAEHIFEHFYHPEETFAFLKECKRCLESGGVLRIVVPDAGKYIRLYGGDWQVLAATRRLQLKDGLYHDAWGAYATQMQFMNVIFRQGTEHKYAWDAETLLLTVFTAGFTNVVEKSFGKSVKGTPLDSEARRTESLYVEAIK